MKGGNIVVEGKIGYQSGFMAHSGKSSRWAARVRLVPMRSKGRFGSPARLRAWA